MRAGLASAARIVSSRRVRAASASLRSTSLQNASNGSPASVSPGRSVAGSSSVRTRACSATSGGSVSSARANTWRPRRAAPASLSAPESRCGTRADASSSPILPVSPASHRGSATRRHPAAMTTDFRRVELAPAHSLPASKSAAAANPVSSRSSRAPASSAFSPGSISPPGSSTIGRAGPTRNCSKTGTLAAVVNATTATVSPCSSTSQSDSDPSGRR